VTRDVRGGIIGTVTVSSIINHFQQMTPLQCQSVLRNTEAAAAYQGKELLNGRV
jgi:hypothetical protein